MNSSEPAKVIASVFALAAFAVAIIAGLAAGNTPASVLGTAVVGMLVCHALGLVAGTVGERVVMEHIEQMRSRSAVSETKAQAAAPAAPSTQSS